MWLAGLFRTHPFSKERMFDLRDYIAARYPQAVQDPRYLLGSPPFEAATAGLRKTRQGYELYDQARQLEEQDRLSEAVALYYQSRSRQSGGRGPRIVRRARRRHPPPGEGDPVFRGGAAGRSRGLPTLPVGSLLLDLPEPQALSPRPRSPLPARA